MLSKQCQRVYDRLKQGPLTPLQSWSEIGVYRLSARIKDLRDAGINVRRDRVKVKNSWGETCRVAKYSLVDYDAENATKGKSDEQTRQDQCTG